MKPMATNQERALEGSARRKAEESAAIERAAVEGNSSTQREREDDKLDREGEAKEKEKVKKGDDEPKEEDKPKDSDKPKGEGKRESDWSSGSEAAKKKRRNVDKGEDAKKPDPRSREKEAQEKLEEAQKELKHGQQKLVEAQEKLEEAQEELKEALRSGTTDVVVRLLEQTVEDARKNVEDARKAVEDARQMHNHWLKLSHFSAAEEKLEEAQKELTHGQQKLVEAQEKLEEAQEELKEALRSGTTDVVVRLLEQTVEDARKNVEDARKNVADARKAVEDARQMRKHWLKLSHFSAAEDPTKRQLVVSQDIESNKRLRAGIVAIDAPQITIQKVQYVTLPASFLKKCGYDVSSDLMLYCRRQMRDLWSFLQNEVVAKNGRGFIVGPPGTGKSLSTLSFVASLDHQEWNVVWIHLTTRLDTCLALGTREYWKIDDLKSFELPRVAGKKLIICLDGYKATTAHELLFKRVFAHLDETNERLLVCSSMATLGKRNVEDDRWAKIRVFFMYSWTHDDYIAAIADQTFYDKIVSKLDATGSNEVNGDDGFEAERSETDKKKHAVDLKFYYAGGSCRFMFEYLTDEVVKILRVGVRSAANKSDLVKYCRGDLHIDAINRLYGMQPDGDDNASFPVSSYVASLFAKECDEETIVQLAVRLNASNNPSVDGHLLEWLFLASVPKRAVKLFGDHGVEEVLPQANVLRFDPKKRFIVLRDGQIKGDQSWLQPTAWNQGGYDAVHFDKDEGKVIFVQVTRSDKHDFKMRFFREVLYKLKNAGMEIKQVVVYFVVKPAQYLNFKIHHVEDRDVLLEFDASWTRPEESHVRVRAFRAVPV